MRVGWAAGKWSTNLDRLCDDLVTFVKTEDLSMALTSESQQKGVRAAVARAFGPDWGVSKSGEYLWIYKRSEFKPTLRHAYLYYLSRVTNLADWRNFKIGDKWFRHRASGRVIAFMPGHAPSGVQYGDVWNPLHPLQVEASKKGFHNLGRRVNRRKRTHPKLVQVILLDSNLDQKLAIWRNFLTKEIGAPSIWAHADRSTGSHGNRLIDTGHVYGASVANAYVSEVLVASDHDYVVAVIHVPLARDYNVK